VGGAGSLLGFHTYSSLGVSLMFTYETMELFRITRLSELGMSHIADNVVLL